MLQLQRRRKARARKTKREETNLVCPPNANGAPSSPAVPVPHFPDLLNSIELNSIEGPADGERWKVQDSGAAGIFASDSAEFICGLWTSRPTAYKRPVCGSGNEMDLVRVAPGFCTFVSNSYLGESLFFFF